MKKIKLSVIIPVYNTELYLKECIESVCNQTYANLQVILVDDGSTDRSGEICDRYAKLDERICVIHKSNGGQLSARKIGAEIADGDYIIGVDSDDWIDSDRFERLVNFGLFECPDMVYLKGYYREKPNRSFYVGNDAPDVRCYNKEIQDFLFRYCIGDYFFLDRKIDFSHWKSCIRREIYKKNILSIDSRIRRIEDFITIFSCVLDCRFFMCIEESGYHYRDREGSINKRNTNWEDIHAEVYYKQMGEILKRHEEDMDPRLVEVAVQYCYQNLLLTNYKKAYQFYKGFLFPYREIMNGSRIVVYGAGNIGVELVNAIDMDSRFDIVAWVDKEVKKNPRSTRHVESVDVIFQRCFDYIVVAVLLFDTAASVKRDLICLGIPLEKIKLMQTRDMSMEYLNSIFEG